MQNFIADKGNQQLEKLLSIYQMPKPTYFFSSKVKERLVVLTLAQDTEDSLKRAPAGGFSRFIAEQVLATATAFKRTQCFVTSNDSGYVKKNVNKFFGGVSRDFRPQFFFINRTHLGPG